MPGFPILHYLLEFVDKAEGNQLFFAASVCHPQTDEYIPLIVTVSNFGEVGISRDQDLE